jgi:hypothetical protein
MFRPRNFGQWRLWTPRPTKAFATALYENPRAKHAVIHKTSPFARLPPLMAGLGLFDQKSALAVTIPIVTAFKFCIGHRKMGS